MVFKSCYVASAIAFMIPALSYAAPADPYAKLYDALIGTARDDCHGAGISRSKSIIDAMPVNPHQRADLMAQAVGQCISEGHSVAELIYANLHSGRMSMDSVNFCGTRVDAPSPQQGCSTL